MSKHILVVEDSPTQAMRAEVILKKHGYLVTKAEDGRAGLKKVSECKPDLVITDVIMPNMDGYQFCETLKSNPVTSQIPVVMLTTKDKITDIIRGLAVGADNFITKPYEGDYLLSRVQAILKNVSLKRKGELLEDLEMNLLQKRIALTTNRQQILKLIMSTAAVTVHCSAMGIFLLSNKNCHKLFLISLQPLSDKSNSDLTSKVIGAATAMSTEPITEKQIETTTIVEDEELPSIEDKFPSFVSVPLINKGRVIGILTMANNQADAFDADNARLLFLIGSEAASYLDKIER
jgi:DNA-binding response OmpR family regulator